MHGSKQNKLFFVSLLGAVSTKAFEIRNVLTSKVYLYLRLLTTKAL